MEYSILSQAGKLLGNGEFAHAGKTTKDDYAHVLGG